jgi:NTP pyrophosphatase (non-canonical NTP hydrolase)
MEKLIESVEKWSKDKKINVADSSKQMLKVVEETGEVAAALARSDKEALKDGIGDVIVTLIILAQQNNMTLQECLEFAYDEIKNRKGETVNGVFVKESDL